MKIIENLALIPARAGSKGIVNKNTYPISGKPLIEYTINSAINSKYLDEIHLSSDSNEIINLSDKLGVKSYYLRPKNLSNDTASALDVMLYHINWLKEKKNISVENLIYLQPTSPIRKDSLIDDAIKKFKSSNSQSLVAICECSQHPFETVYIKKDKIFKFPSANKYTRRQDYPNYYFISGSIYIYKVKNLLKEKNDIHENSDYIITSNEEGVDIDNLLDLKVAESLINNF